MEGHVPRRAATRRASAGRASTVLYIEDNPSNVKVVQAALRLRPQHLRLLTANAGKRGLDVAKRTRPDLILLDMHLPDVNGVEVLTRLKSNESTRRIPVIVLSADVAQSVMERALAEGAHAYITKPLHLDEFLAEVDRALRSRA